MDDSRENRIYKKLNQLVGPGPAEFFQAATWLINNESRPQATSHLVGHLMREIESALRQVVVPFISGDKGQTEEIPEKGKEKDAHANNVRKILSTLGFEADDEVTRAWLSLIGAGREGIDRKPLYARAHRNALAPSRPVDSDFKLAWQEMMLVIEAVLDALEKRYLSARLDLDRLKSKESPSRADAAFLKNNFPYTHTTFRYFFDNLENPDWLPPLRENGFFDNPPSSITHEAGGRSFPAWPISGYLIRMASKNPEEVAKAVNQIETDNLSVRVDIIKTCTEMPASIAVHFVDKISAWLDEPYMLIPSATSNLIIHLASNQFIDEALHVTEELLRVEKGKHPQGLFDDEETQRWAPEPRPRIDLWEFETFIRDSLPELITLSPQKTLLILSDLLERALELRISEGLDDFDDYSMIWRPAIEPHLQNRLHGDVFDLLVSAVRDAAEQVVEEDANKLVDTISYLNSKKWMVFRRIALHVLSLFGQHDLNLVEDSILEFQHFQSRSLMHEYSLLVRDHFAVISDEGRDKFLSWIGDPDDHLGDEDHTEIRNAIRWLTILTDHLPDKYISWKEKMLGDEPEPDHPDLAIWSSEVQVGPTSPVSEEEILILAENGLIDFLESWEPSDGHSMELPEGISRALTSAVAKEPNKFERILLDLLKVDKTYIRGVLNGYREALKENVQFDWIALIQFLNGVTHSSLKSDEQVSSEYLGRDPDWSWTRTEIARLLKDGLINPTNPIPHTEKDLVWETLSLLLTEDWIDPIEEQDQETPDFGLQVLNSTQGVAFQGVIAYALWHKNWLVKTEGLNASEVILDQIPEVKSVLEDHLFSEKRRSLIIHSIFGWRYPNLSYLDHKWALQNRESIFPQQDNKSDEWHAAWGALVRFNTPSVQLLTDLESEYLFAISLLTDQWPKTSLGVDTGELTVNHLMTYYAFGNLDLKSPPINRFFDCAGHFYRLHALHFIGTKLTAINEEVNKRLQALWDQFINYQDDDPDKRIEAKQFGWWFSRGSLDAQWALNQLMNVLEYSGGVEDHYGVAQRLSEMAHDWPIEVIDCFTMMINLEDQEPWFLLSLREGLATALEVILSQDNPEALSAAETLINRLEARGMTGFSELLD